MKLCIENDDTICIKNNCIEVDIKNIKYSFNKSEIEEIHIITTNLGPAYCDMCLAIKINNKDTTVIFIMSEHPLYNRFLFEELNQIVDLDYQAIIEAAACVENKLFLIDSNR